MELIYVLIAYKGGETYVAGVYSSEEKAQQGRLKLSENAWDRTELVIARVDP